MAILAVAGFGIAGCNKPPAAAAGGGFAPAVTVAVAKFEDVPVFLDEIGTAVASESVMIQPQVTGKILKRYFKDGDNLKVGDPLFDIDDSPYKATLHQAQGQLAKDKAQFDNNTSIVNRDEKAMAGNEGALSQTTYETDKASRDEAKASMEADNAAIEAANVNLAYCRIASPISGLAGTRLVDVGNVVTAAGQGTGTNLLAIQNLDPIYVNFTIPESELPRVRSYMSQGTLVVKASLPEDTAQITAAAMPTTTATAAPGTDKPVEPTAPPAGATTMPTTAPTTKPIFEPRDGTLDFLDNSVQDGTGTIKLRATIPNSDRHFWPGQFVNVRLILQTKKAVMIPRQATQISQVGPFVYVIQGTDKTTVKQTPISLGQRHGEMVMVDSGVNAGDRVVVTGQGLIFMDGAPVTVVPSGPPAGAGGH